jgi:enoyl-CoA hydratase/carnithine racemase
MPMPTLAVIRGLCLGAGASLACACDLRICGNDAVFAVPAARLGLGYDPRGILRFVRIFGSNATRELLFTGGRIPAERACRIGAVTGVVNVAGLEAAASSVAAQIEANAPLTLRSAKIALRAGSFNVSDDLMAEAEKARRAADASADYLEGRRAFAEKRLPLFRGR